MQERWSQQWWYCKLAFNWETSECSIVFNDELTSDVTIWILATSSLSNNLWVTSPLVITTTATTPAPWADRQWMQIAPVSQRSAPPTLGCTSGSAMSAFHHTAAHLMDSWTGWTHYHLFYIIRLLLIVVGLSPNLNSKSNCLAQSSFSLRITTHMKFPQSSTPQVFPTVHRPHKSCNLRSQLPSI